MTWNVKIYRELIKSEKRCITTGKHCNYFWSVTYNSTLLLNHTCALYDITRPAVIWRHVCPQVRLYYDWFLVPGSCKCWKHDVFAQYRAGGRTPKSANHWAYLAVTANHWTQRTYVSWLRTGVFVNYMCMRVFSDRICVSSSWARWCEAFLAEPG